MKRTLTTLAEAASGPLRRVVLTVTAMGFHSLFRWLWPGRSQRAKLRVELYTRRGCHLCEDVWEQLLAAQRRYPLAVETVDVDSVAELVARYGECVPVVVVDGKE